MKAIERTFAWLGRNRRLSKDYEALPPSGEAFVYVSMIRLIIFATHQAKASETPISRPMKHALTRITVENPEKSDL
jgi:hypothetical protein